MQNAIRATALAAVAALALAGCDQAGRTTLEPKAGTTAAPAAPPIATVNGKPISAEAFALFVEAQGGRKAEELTPEQRKDAVDMLVNLYVAGQQAEKDGLAKDPKTAAQLELQRLNVLANGLFQKQVQGKEPTEAELKAEYDRQVATMPKNEYRARHILVQTEQEAKDAIAEIGKGAKFEDVAKKVSLDGSKAEGGDLGWFSPGQMVKPFADAVEGLQPGQMTPAPVKTDFGWHVIRVEETRAATPPPYEAVKDRLGPMMQQRQLREYIEGLRKAAKIEIKG